MGWNERDLKIWYIYTRAVTYLFAVAAAGILAWGLCENNIPHFLVLFSFLLLGITIIFLVRICQKALPGRVEHPESSLPCISNKNWSEWFTKFLLFVVIGLGAGFMTLGWSILVAFPQFTEGGINVTATFIVGTFFFTVGLALCTHSFSFNQVILSNKENEKLREDITEMKDCLKTLSDEVIRQKRSQ